MHRLSVIKYRDGNYPLVNIGIVTLCSSLMDFRVTPEIFLISGKYDDYRKALSQLVEDLNSASKTVSNGTWHFLSKYLESHIRDKCFTVSDAIDVPNLDFDILYGQLVRT